MKNVKITFIGILFLISGCKSKSEYPINRTKNDLKEGVHIQLDPLGKLEIATFNNGELNGEYLRYYEGNKTVYIKAIYRNDKLSGQSYYFYQSGALMYQREWKDGKKIGYAMDFYETGETQAVMFYNSEGSLIWRNTYDKEGNLIKKE